MFDVAYTIDEHGRRVLRPWDEPRSSPPEASVHLFGGSFVFGFGLEDGDSLPWQLQERLGDAYHVYGWAQMGWGAHQALARFESGEVEAAQPALPATVVYWAIGDHTRRLLGERSWDRKGPRYVLDGDGRATYAGSFAAPRDSNPLASAGESFASRSWLWKKLRTNRSAVSRGDVELWAAVVDELRDEAERVLPECRFAVLLETGNADGAAMAPALERRGIEILAIGDFLGDDSASAPRWKLDPRDGHPSGLAAAEIASGLAAWIGRDRP